MTNVVSGRFFRWFLFLALIVVSGLAHGQSVSYSWLATDASVTDLDKVQALPESDWKPMGSTNTVNIGFSDNAVWIRATLPPAVEDRVLKIAYPLLDHVSLAWMQDGEIVREYQVGDRRPFDARPIPNRNFIFPVPDSEATLMALIRVESEGSMQVPISVVSSIKFLSDEQVHYGWQAVFLGIMIAMAVYNIFVMLIVRHSAYLWYVLTVVASAMVILNFNGLLFQWLWPDAPIINRYFTAPVIAANVLFATMFAIHYLQMQKYSPWSYRIMQSVAVVSLAGVVFGAFGDYQTATAFVSILAVVVAPLAFVIGLVVWRKGQVLAGFYALAWAPLLIGHLINAISKIGLIPASILTEAAPQIGVTLEVMLLSFALAYRISLERKRRLQAQERTLDVQRRANQTLEARVQARTEELERANEQLKALTITDGLTQVANRRLFDEKLETEWARARRHGHYLSVIIFDLDHFKRVNDAWGHLAGDDCLIRVATICDEIIQRTGDLLARYGGEEFVVLLPETPESGAQLVAERLRKAVSAAPIETAASEECIAVTISVGVATLVPGSEQEEVDLTAADLVQRADDALYSAKSAGRNRVMLFREDSPDASLAKS